MTRLDIVNDYQVDQHGVIRTPGKFEGEMLFVPYFWNLALEGCADFDDDGVYAFEITAEHIKEFPELEDIKVLALEECNSGFVYVWGQSDRSTRVARYRRREDN